jgi:hypothetical protein
MKILDAVFFTDNKTVRLETADGNFYLTDEKKVYDMHPVNIMANEISGSLLKEVKAAAKKDKFKNDTEVRKWI